MNVKNAMSFARYFSNRNAASILTGLALAGLAATVVLAYKKAPETKRVLERSRRKVENLDPKKESYKEEKREIVEETAKKLVPEVAPVLIMAAVTGACILGSNKVSSKKIAVLSAGYNLARSNLSDLNEEMRKLLGDKKATEVKDAVTEKRFKNCPNKKAPEPKKDHDGMVSCWDIPFGKPFRSNREIIGQAINQLSAECQQTMYVSLSDFYDLIGAKTFPIANDIGWNVEDLFKGQLPITMTSVLDEDGIPCLAVDYDISVRNDFRSLH